MRMSNTARQITDTPFIKGESKAFSEYFSKEFKGETIINIDESATRKQGETQNCQINDYPETTQKQADSLDGVVQALEKGVKSGRNLAKLKIKPLPFADTALGLSDEDREIIKGKIKFKKSLERFGQVIKKSERLKNITNKNSKVFKTIAPLNETGEDDKLIKDRELEDYSNLLEKLANGFKKLYTAIDKFVIIPPINSKYWSGFVKEVLNNKNLLSKINFKEHELLSLFVCHGFIIAHSGKSRLSGFAKVFLANKDFNPFNGKIFEKYPLMDIRNPEFYGGSWFKKNSFIKAVIKKYYGIGIAEFEKRYLIKKGSLIN